jgi:hypothetical protein
MTHDHIGGRQKFERSANEKNRRRKALNRRFPPLSGSAATELSTQPQLVPQEAHANTSHEQHGESWNIHGVTKPI